MTATFYFVAGEQVVTLESLTVLDAWLKFTNRARRLPVADEFRRLPIEAYDTTGAKLATRTWQGWQDELAKDTYGSNWREYADHAAELM